MSIQEPRIIDEIYGLYDGRKVDQIDRENGKVDYKVRKRATKRRHVARPRTVKTDYRLDPDKDVKEVETRDGRKRIYLIPVSDGLQVHRDKTVHRRKMRQLERSFDRETQKLRNLERENRKLRRKITEITGEEREDEKDVSAPQQRYDCTQCEQTMTEKQAEANDYRCSNCNQENLEVQD